MIYCHVTTGCNLTCPFCFSKQVATELTGDQWVIILSKLDGEDRELDFTGGEPLLKWSDVVRPLMEWQAQKYVNRQFESAISTNGTLVTQAIAECLAAYQTRVTVTVNGDAAYVDGHMGEGVYAQIMAGLSTLQAAGARIRLRLVLTRHNIELIPHFEAVCAQYASPHEINMIQKLFGVNPDDDISAEQEATIVAAGEKPGFALNATFHGMRPCFVPSFTIRPDGLVIPCAAQWQTVLGDLLTEEPQVILSRCTNAMQYGCRL